MRAVTLALLGACAVGPETEVSVPPSIGGGAEPGFGVDVGGPGAEVTWHRDIRPLVETHCLGCHAEGGIAPFTLTHDPDEWENASAWWAPAAVRAVEAGTMPPWPASDDCHPIEGSR
ncbi:MAG: hypothetical protein KC656_33625, partial [Myxococcales bacterium]|nr:hypothetical protein [Myxococcales bacterium]